MSAYVRAKEAAMREMSARYPAFLVRIPRDEWPVGTNHLTNPPAEVWRSRQFLVMVYEGGEHTRLSVVRVGLAPDGKRFADGISWDELQRLKRECGRGNSWAVEVFPSDDQIVNVSNMRHLWLIPEPPYGWKDGRS